MRVLLDANILISYLVPSSHTNAVSAIMEAAYSGQITLLVSDDLLHEVVESIKTKPRLAKRITLQGADDLATSLLDLAEVLLPLTESIPAISRDPKDDYLLAHALIGKADYLISRDKDLLTLGEVEWVKIMQPAEFLQVLRQQE
ncbi:MAG: putative toxin-antitoxin system toxin component, PIN family [Chloroflexota bacterium]|nr:putative toxin-antitoxin system toxin component, PIN family [Chloroflexota bacterium]